MDDDLNVRVNDIKEANNIKLVFFSGVLDTRTSADAEKTVITLINEGRSVVLDCSNVTYMNSIGLAALVRFFIQAKRRNLGFKLVNPSEVMRKVMEIAGANDVLEICASAEEAVEKIRK